MATTRYITITNSREHDDILPSSCIFFDAKNINRILADVDFIRSLCIQNDNHDSNSNSDIATSSSDIIIKEIDPISTPDFWKKTLHVTPLQFFSTDKKNVITSKIHRLFDLSTIDEFAISLEHIINLASARGDLETLTVLRHKDAVSFKCTNCCISRACAYGDIKVLLWWFNSGLKVEYTYYTFWQIIRGKHFEVLIVWLRFLLKNMLFDDEIEEYYSLLMKKITPLEKTDISRTDEICYSLVYRILKAGNVVNDPNLMEDKPLTLYTVVLRWIKARDLANEMASNTDTKQCGKMMYDEADETCDQVKCSPPR